MGRRTLSLILAGFISIAGVSAPMATPQAVGFEPFEIIGQRNLFSPQRGMPPAPQLPAPEAAAPDVTTREAINVVGIVKTKSAESTFAIIEEAGRHRMCRIGETVCGMLILEIRAEEVVFEDVAGSWGARIQPPVPTGSLSVPQPTLTPADAAVVRARASSPSARRVPIRTASVPRMVRTIGLVTDVQEGTTRGLRLTQDFMGLREGDCITVVGCQSLGTEHPKQKLWQIVRKYGSGSGQAFEIPVIIERDNRQIEIVLHPFG